MPTTYQDVVRANSPLGSWALTEAGGFVFVPWISASQLVGSGTFLYRQAGPFASAFGLHLAAATQIHVLFLTTVQPPFTSQLWVKLDVNPPAANGYLLKSGASTNGAGFYVKTDGHVHWEAGGVQDIDTGTVWPDLNWHLVTWCAESTTVQSLYLDGAIVWRTTVSAPAAPAPNVEGFASEGSGGTVNIVGTIAYPTLYPYALTPSQVAATFLAASDPATALGGTLNAGGAGPGGSLDLLNQILAAVRKTFPTT